MERPTLNELLAPTVRLASGLVLASLAALACGCSSSSDCQPLPPEATQAVFALTCDASDLRSVEITGPCAESVSGASVDVFSPSPGSCHIVLTFGTGFTYAADVTFASMTQRNCGQASSYVGPTQATFNVDNPAATCTDGG